MAPDKEIKQKITYYKTELQSPFMTGNKLSLALQSQSLQGPSTNTPQWSPNKKPLSFYLSLPRKTRSSAVADMPLDARGRHATYSKHLTSSMKGIPSSYQIHTW